MRSIFIYVQVFSQLFRLKRNVEDVGEGYIVSNKKGGEGSIEGSKRGRKSGSKS